MNRKTWTLGKLTVQTSRWPNQGYGWFPHKNNKGPKGILNSSGARFGAGWTYKLGIDFGGNSILLNLLFGMIVLSWRRA